MVLLGSIPKYVSKNGTPLAEFAWSLDGRSICIRNLKMYSGHGLKER